MLNAKVLVDVPGRHLARQDFLLDRLGQLALGYRRARDKSWNTENSAHLDLQAKQFETRGRRPGVKAGPRGTPGFEQWAFGCGTVCGQWLTQILDKLLER